MHKLERRPLAVAIAGLLSGYLAGHSAMAETLRPDGVPPGILVEPSTGLRTGENGDVQIVQVSLTAPPATLAVVDILSDNAELHIEPGISPLLFDTTNWNVPRSVTLIGMDDAVVDGDVTAGVLFAAHSDAVYDGVSTHVTVVNEDDEDPGLIVTPMEGLTTTEGGGTATFTVALTAQPVGLVNVALFMLSFEGDVILPTEFPQRLRFYPQDWMVPQTVIVRGNDDYDEDGDAAYGVQLLTMSPSTPRYHGLTAIVPITNLDDEGLQITPTSALRTTEAPNDNAATFTVALQSRPPVDVNVAILSLDESEGTVAAPSMLQFNQSDWHVPHTVTVYGVDDADEDGDVPYNVQLRTLADYPSYDNRLTNVALISLDDEMSATTIVAVEGIPGPSRSVEPVTARFLLDDPVPDAGNLAPTGTVTVTVDTGETCTATLPADSCELPPLTTVGWRSLVAEYSGDAVHLASDGEGPHIVARRADLAITTTSAPTLLYPGMALDYVTVVSNAGPDLAPGTRVADYVPNGLLGAQWSCLPLNGGECDVASGSGDIDRTLDLEPGATLIYTLSGTVATPEPATITNSVSVTPLALEPGFVLDPDSDDRSDAETDIGYRIFDDGFEVPAAPDITGIVHVDRQPAGMLAIDPSTARGYADDTIVPLLSWRRGDIAQVQLDARRIGGQFFGRLAERDHAGLWRFGTWTPLPAAVWQLKWAPATESAGAIVELRAGDVVITTGP